jgi:hypothetical protein
METEGSCHHMALNMYSSGEVQCTGIYCRVVNCLFKLRSMCLHYVLFLFMTFPIENFLLSFHVSVVCHTCFTLFYSIIRGDQLKLRSFLYVLSAFSCYLLLDPLILLAIFFWNTAVLCTSLRNRLKQSSDFNLI